LILGQFLAFSTEFGSVRIKGKDNQVEIGVLLEKLVSLKIWFYFS
jgi:hypothetical protein